MSKHGVTVACSFFTEPCKKRSTFVSTVLHHLVSSARSLSLADASSFCRALALFTVPLLVDPPGGIALQGASAVLVTAGFTLRILALEARRWGMSCCFAKSTHVLQLFTVVAMPWYLPLAFVLQAVPLPLYHFASRHRTLLLFSLPIAACVRAVRELAGQAPRMFLAVAMGVIMVKGFRCLHRPTCAAIVLHCLLRCRVFWHCALRALYCHRAAFPISGVDVISWKPMQNLHRAI